MNCPRVVGDSVSLIFARMALRSLPRRKRVQVTSWRRSEQAERGEMVPLTKYPTLIYDESVDSESSVSHLSLRCNPIYLNVRSSSMHSLGIGYT